MKVIIAGGRDIEDMDLLLDALRSSGIIHQITEVVSGMARGVDSLAVQWASKFGLPVTPFPANWDLHGRAAGPIRNKQMADYSEALIAIWDSKSRGTKNMIDTMQKMSKLVYIYYV